jgi:hypothetical protein
MADRTLVTVQVGVSKAILDGNWVNGYSNVRSAVENG